MSEPTDTAVLEEVLDPLGACLTPEVARRIVGLRAPESLQRRMQDFAARNNEGTLSDAELATYNAYVSAGTFVAILQSKARKVLANEQAS